MYTDTTTSNNNSSIIMEQRPDGTIFIPLPEVSEFDVNLNSAATFEEDTDMQLTPSFSVPTLEFKIPPTPESMESNNPSTPYTPGKNFLLPPNARYGPNHLFSSFQTDLCHEIKF